MTDNHTYAKLPLRDPALRVELGERVIFALMGENQLWRVALDKVLRS